MLFIGRKRGLPQQRLFILGELFDMDALSHGGHEQYTKQYGPQISHRTVWVKITALQTYEN